MREKVTVSAEDVGEIRVVSAVGSAVSSRQPKRAAQIEAAMVGAITECYAHGVTDPDTVRAAQLWARQLVLNQED